MGSCKTAVEVEFGQVLGFPDRSQGPYESFPSKCQPDLFCGSAVRTDEIAMAFVGIIFVLP